MCWWKQYLLFTIWKKLLRDICYSLFKKSCYVTKKKWTTNDICYSLFEKRRYLFFYFKKVATENCYLTKEKWTKAKKRTCKSFQTTLHLMQQRWPGKKSCINSQTPKLRLLVKKKPQKNWFKQKLGVFFPSFTRTNVLQTSNVGCFFFFSEKIGDFRTWKQKQVISQSCLDLFCFFLTVIALGQNKTKNVFFVQMTTEQKKRSCFKKFLRVWFSLFWVKLSWERRLKFFSTLFLSLKNKLSQRENFHYVRLVLIFDTVFLKSLILVLIFDTVILKSFDIRYWYFVFWKVILVICYVI